MLISRLRSSRCYKAEEWETIEVETLVEEHGEEIYDSPDSAERRRVDLTTYALLDNDNNERNVFDSLGYRIPRRKVNLPPDAEAAGIFFSLRNLHALFENPFADSDDDAVIPHYVYPIAGLHDVGQFQAHGTFHCFVPLLRLLNQDLSQQNENPHFPGSCVRAIFSQGYNASAHRVRTQARFHDVQRGMITAAFAGSCVSGPSNKRKATDLFNLCETSLPFERYNSKVANSIIDQSIRLENVYVIDLSKLSPAQRNGRYVSYLPLFGLSCLTLFAASFIVL